MNIKKINESLQSIANLLENEIPDWVCDELNRYNDKAGRRLDKKIEPYMEPFKPKGKTTLYRGLGFDRADGVSILKKLKIKGKEGDRGSYKTGKVQSWSSSKGIAREFAGQFTFGGYKVEGSLGILLKTTVDPKSIIAPIGNLPKDVMKGCVRFEQDEYLLHPGTYKIEVVELFGNWPSPDDKDPIKVIKDLRKELPSMFKNVKVTNTWNKAPGFSLEFPDVIFKDGKVEKKRPLSVSFSYEDGMLDLVVDSFDEAVRKIRPKTSVLELPPNKAAEHIEKVLPKDLKKFIEDLIKALKKNGQLI